MASLGLLLTVSSCTDLPVAPGRNSTGNPEPGATSAPGTGPGSAVDPAAAVASIAVTPEALEISAPHYTDEHELSDVLSPSSDGSTLEHESAGFPTAALLAVTFKNEAGEVAPPADILWSSSNPQLVSVDEHGWVYAADTEVGGVATISARLRSKPQVSASATVTVRNDGLVAIELK
jgi:hypothetical protein